MFSERFITNDPTQAHMFFIPITWLQLEEMGIYANADDYVRHIIKEYPHWNRSKGVDHFLVTCCDAGKMFSERVPLNNYMRLSCSARNDDMHHKHHLISIPQMRLPFFPPVRGGYEIQNRTILAFWACHENYPASLNDWDFWDECPGQEKFKASKYCICDGSSHITRMCITESIHFGCVPVILYEDYELPFGDILDWTKFSVIINKDDAYRVEQILEAIPDSKFSELHNNIRKVQRHFHGNSSFGGRHKQYDVLHQWHLHANSAFRGHDKPYDVFHMIIFELGLKCGGWRRGG
ncbi:probable glycosyltransferase At3g42180 isoform X2 [Tripterygium wilfordii]|uniref:probable glycosyltransferase At3g42180 isoform X2 n=1 Tax=Tripterygium wilfordii TaxID=458696 RepID=UPI0018F8206B|nr:probable glycosyltransferase At3g42180 isoform X2 [Tripterygium wilfordii]